MLYTRAMEFDATKYAALAFAGVLFVAVGFFGFTFLYNYNTPAPEEKQPVSTQKEFTPEEKQAILEDLKNSSDSAPISAAEKASILNDLKASSDSSNTLTAEEKAQILQDLKTQ